MQVVEINIALVGCSTKLREDFLYYFLSNYYCNDKYEFVIHHSEMLVYHVKFDIVRKITDAKNYDGAFLFLSNTFLSSKVIKYCQKLLPYSVLHIITKAEEIEINSVKSQKIDNVKLETDTDFCYFSYNRHFCNDFNILIKNFLSYLTGYPLYNVKTLAEFEEWIMNQDQEIEIFASKMGKMSIKESNDDVQVNEEEEYFDQITEQLKFVSIENEEKALERVFEILSI